MHGKGYRSLPVRRRRVFCGECASQRLACRRGWAVAFRKYSLDYVSAEGEARQTKQASGAVTSECHGNGGRRIGGVRLTRDPAHLDSIVGVAGYAACLREVTRA